MIENEKKWRELFLHNIEMLAFSSSLALPVNINNLKHRLAVGAMEYGNQSFTKPFDELINELSQEMMDLVGWSYIIWAKARVVSMQSGLHSLRQKADDLCRKLESFVVFSLQNSSAGVSELESEVREVGRMWNEDPRRWIGGLVMAGDAGLMKLEALKVDLTENLAEAMSKSGLTQLQIVERMAQHGCRVTVGELREQLAEPTNIDILLVAFCVCGMKIALTEIKDLPQTPEDHPDVD